MSYVRESLVSGEKIVFTAKMHWRILVMPIVFMWFGICVVSVSALNGLG